MTITPLVVIGIYLGGMLLTHLYRLFCIRWWGVWTSRDDVYCTWPPYGLVMVFWPLFMPFIVTGTIVYNGIYKHTKPLLKGFSLSIEKASEKTEKEGIIRLQMPKLPEKKKPKHHTEEPEVLPVVKGR